MKQLPLCLFIFALAGAAAASPAATTERLSVVSNGDVVGSVVAVTDGDRVSVD
jgi:hypothetical protein